VKKSPILCDNNVIMGQMGRYRRKKNNNKDKIYPHLRRKDHKGSFSLLLISLSMCNLTSGADIDQILDDLENPEKANSKGGELELPGGGRFYCVPCSRYFITQVFLFQRIRCVCACVLSWHSPGP